MKVWLIVFRKEILMKKYLYTIISIEFGLGDDYYYKPSSLLWEVIKDDVIHELKLRNKHGSYPYSRRARDGTWGQTSQLTQDEALWLTLEFNPELMGYV